MLLRRVLGALAVLSAAFLPAVAATTNQFYKGKTISIYVGFPAGGGYDIYARVVAPYLSRHIPGNPLVIVRNMEGGSGTRVAGYLSNATAQDGLSLGMFLDTTILGKMLGGPGDFKPDALKWVGRIASTQSVAMVWHTAPAQTIEQAKKKRLVVAVTQASNSASMIATALNDLVGTRFKIVRGYQGSPPQALAMERGEVDAVGGMSWEYVQSSYHQWLDKGLARVMYTFGNKRVRGASYAPALTELATTDRARKILDLFASAPDIGRAFAAEPRIPPERLQLLRTAFSKTMADPEFQKEMQHLQLVLDPIGGDAVQKLVDAALATPKNLLDDMNRYIQ